MSRTRRLVAALAAMLALAGCQLDPGTLCAGEPVQRVAHRVVRALRRRRRGGVVSGAWEWRKASGGWWFPSVETPSTRKFHAYDVNDNAACSPGAGLVASCEEPNEGSDLCPECIDVVKAEPWGRERVVYEPLRAAGGAA